MSKIIVVDTDILIDISRDYTPSRQKFDEAVLAFSPVISTITAMELVVGCRNKNELKNLEKFLAIFDLVPLTDEISRLAFLLLKNYNLSHGLLIPDALIAATALFFNAPLLTKNLKDFKFISKLILYTGR